MHRFDAFRGDHRSVAITATAATPQRKRGLLRHSSRTWRMRADSSLLIGAVLVPGAKAPKLISREMLRCMRPGSVMVDIAVDQGGCAETSKATTHADPTYVVDEVVHYCVANMPGAVARTSTLALNNATLPFVIALAEKGPRRALEEDPHLLAGLNVARGAITCASVAEAHGLAYQPASGVLASL